MIGGRAHCACLLFACLATACDEKPQTPAGDTEPPFLFIIAPVDSATLVGPDSIRIAATDDEGVVRVAAYLDADSLGEDLTPPYAIAFNPLRVGADTFALRASAWDAAGNRGEAPPLTILTPDAALRITQPAADAVVSGTVAVRIEAVRPELIAEVELLVDGVQVGTAGPAPFTVSWDTEAWSDGGPHLLEAVAELGGAQVASPPLTVRVAPGTQAIPSVITPEAEAIEPLSMVLFSWTRQPHASEYQLQVGLNSYFGTLAFQTVVSDTFLQHEVPSSGYRYVRVRAGFGDPGWSDWSPTHRYRQCSLRDGILDLPSMSAGEDAAFASDGRHLVAGYYASKAFIIIFDADGLPRIAKQLLEAETNTTIERVAARPEGGWLLLIRRYSSTPQYRVLEIDAAGEELSRRSVPAEGTNVTGRGGLVALDQGAVALVLNTGTAYSTYLLRLDSLGGTDWVNNLLGYSEYHDGFLEWLKCVGVELLSRSGGELARIGFVDASYYDGLAIDWLPLPELPLDRSGRLTFGFVQTLDSATGALLDAVGFPAATVAAACADPAGTTCAVGTLADGQVALFLVPPDLGIPQSVALPLNSASIYMRGIAALGAGDFVIAGRRNNNALLFRAQADGTLIWLHELGDPNFVDAFTQVLVDSDGTILAIGRTKSPDYSFSALWLKRFDAAGNDITP